MSLSNYNTNEIKNKPLTDIEMGKIEAYLYEGLKPAEIARRLGREASGIRKEIKNYSSMVLVGSKKCKTTCNRYEECKESKLCGENPKGCKAYCKGCELAITACKKYEEGVSCKRLKGHTKVCNDCKTRQRCRDNKIYYDAEKAAKMHKEIRRNSVKKLQYVGEKQYLSDIAKRVRQGQSPKVILNTLQEKHSAKMSLPTFYSYIDNKRMECSNTDLRNKLKRKPKNEKIEEKQNKSKHRANGRSYHDMTEIEKGKTEYGNAQMDLVIGTTEGKPLMTLLEKKTSFLFGFVLENKKQDEVIRRVDELEMKLGRGFEKMFKTLLTDNGSEFLDYERLEKSVQSEEKRTAIKYADPYASYQKGMIENQHRLIRYFFPKGVDFGKYSEEVIIDRINRINNYPREGLGWTTPYKEMEKMIGKALLETLGFYEISLDDLNMTNKKVA